MTMRDMIQSMIQDTFQNTTQRVTRTGALALALVIGALATATAMTGCSGGTTTTVERPDIPVVAGPMALSGTIGQLARLDGIDPVLVSGYGLVVNLNGTGGQPLPDNIAATMEREMGLMGVSRSSSPEGTALAGRSPSQVLRDPNVAVVLVQAVVPPGAPVGTTFDVYVRAINASSLEGGTLWTTELQIGGPEQLGGFASQKIAKARGDVFVNPFIEPGSGARGNSNVVGRVLDGGVIDSPLDMLLTLDNASHARARSVVSAVNSRFPPAAGDRERTARGVDGERIGLTVPSRYRENPNEFIQMVEYLQVDQRFPEEYARRYTRALVEEPGLGGALSWALEALGEPAVPFVRELYDHPEYVPRLAALRAGAKLGDARSASYLVDIAKDGPTIRRVEAIRLMGSAPGGPSVDLALRELLGERELTVRIAAYEALAERAERAELRRLLGSELDRRRGAGDAVSYASLKARTRAFLPAGSIQGVQRQVVEGKFILDVVPIGDPLIYITQQGTPRIVLFGADLNLERPTFVSAWSDRLMLASDGLRDPIRMYYRDFRTDRVSTGEAPDEVARLIRLLAHDPTPERPTAGRGLGGGLGLTYSEIVGALYAIYEQGGVQAAFATERDRLLAELMDAGRATVVEERPETADEEELVLFDPTGGDVPQLQSPSGEIERRSVVVPLNGGAAASQPGSGGTGNISVDTPIDTPIDTSNDRPE